MPVVSPDTCAAAFIQGIGYESEAMDEGLERTSGETAGRGCKALKIRDLYNEA
jgi:hypothetical protein